MKNTPRFDLGDHVYVVDFGYIRDKLYLDFTKEDFAHKVTEDDLALFGEVIYIAIERRRPVLYNISRSVGASVHGVPESLMFRTKEEALKKANEMITDRFNRFFSKVNGIYKPA